MKGVLPYSLQCQGNCSECYKNVCCSRHWKERARPCLHTAAAVRMYNVRSLFRNDIYVGGLETYIRYSPLHQSRCFPRRWVVPEIQYYADQPSQYQQPWHSRYVDRKELVEQSVSRQQEKHVEIDMLETMLETSKKQYLKMLMTAAWYENSDFFAQDLCKILYFNVTILQRLRTRMLPEVYQMGPAECPLIRWLIQLTWHHQLSLLISHFCQFLCQHLSLLINLSLEGVGCQNVALSLQQPRCTASLFQRRLHMHVFSPGMPNFLMPWRGDEGQ